MGFDLAVDAHEGRDEPGDPVGLVVLRISGLHAVGVEEEVSVLFGLDPLHHQERSLGVVSTPAGGGVGDLHLGTDKGPDGRVVDGVDAVVAGVLGRGISQVFDQAAFFAGARLGHHGHVVFFVALALGPLPLRVLFVFRGVLGGNIEHHVVVLTLGDVVDTFELVDLQLPALWDGRGQARDVAGEDTFDGALFVQIIDEGLDEILLHLGRHPVVDTAGLVEAVLTVHHLQHEGHLGHAGAGVCDGVGVGGAVSRHRVVLHVVVEAHLEELGGLLDQVPVQDPDGVRAADVVERLRDGVHRVVDPALDPAHVLEHGVDALQLVLLHLGAAGAVGHVQGPSSSDLDGAEDHVPILAAGQLGEDDDADGVALHHRPPCFHVQVEEASGVLQRLFGEQLRGTPLLGVIGA